MPPGGRILPKIYKTGCKYFTYIGRLYVTYLITNSFFETEETSKSKNSWTIWQHVILSLHSKWFEVRTIYFYGPFLLKYPTKSHTKWGEWNWKACSGKNTRKLVWRENSRIETPLLKAWTLSNLFEVSITIHIKELRETWE